MLARRDLAERLHCDPSNVTLLVDRLESRGLIERSANPTDRRVKAIKLTPNGCKARERLVRSTVETPVFQSLSEVERRDLLRLLRRCAGRG